jgi:hypothetical protein
MAMVATSRMAITVATAMPATIRIGNASEKNQTESEQVIVRL